MAFRTSVSGRTGAPDATRDVGKNESGARNPGTEEEEEKKKKEKRLWVWAPIGCPRN